MYRAEHILLESQSAEVPSPAGARKVHATLRCRSTLRRRSVDLTIFDYHCVAVRSRRGGSGRKYVLDLRFIEPAVRLSRHVPWRWIGVALALTLLAALLGWRSETSSTHLRQIIGGAAAAGLTIAATCAYIIAAFRLTETIAVRTLHGRAAVLEYTGGLAG